MVFQPPSIFSGAFAVQFPGCYPPGLTNSSLAAKKSPNFDGMNYQDFDGDFHGLLLLVFRWCMLICLFRFEVSNPDMFFSF